MPARLGRVSAFLLLLACDPKTTGTTDAAPIASNSAPVVEAGPPPDAARTMKDYPSGGTITLQLQKYVPIEFLAHGTWVALAPKGESAIVGGPGRTSFFPGDKVIPGDASNAAFASDGKRFLVIHPGTNAVTNEVLVHATNDLHVLMKLQNALDVRWLGDDLVFDKDGQVFRASAKDANAPPKLIGPDKAAFKDRPLAVAIAPNLESMVVAEQTNRHLTAVRRIALTGGGRDLTLLGADVIAKLEKIPEPVAVIAPDASRACVMGAIRTETVIWCATDEVAAEPVVSFSDPKRLFNLAFIGPDRLWHRSTSAGAVGIVDFKARTAATMNIPGGTAATDLTPLPSGAHAVARDFFRLGIVDFEGKKFTPIGDEKASPKAVAGLAPDDSIFAVTGASLDGGLGVFKVPVN